MELSHFVKMHGLTRASKLLSKPISTIQSWVKSGKDYRIGMNGDNFGVFVWK